MTNEERLKRNRHQKRWWDNLSEERKEHYRAINRKNQREHYAKYSQTRGYKEIPPELIKEIREQYKAGCYMNEIHRLLGVSIITVKKYL